MFNIRRNVFETNSSATNVFCIITEKELTEWQENDLYFNYKTGQLLTQDEAYNLVKNSEDKDLDLAEDDIIRYSNKDNFFYEYGYEEILKEFNKDIGRMYLIGIDKGYGEW